MQVLAPTIIDRVIGVSKAYMTRVGEGPFPTELIGAEGDRLRETGAEIGVTTGRPRRCGWFDAVLGRYSVRINGLDCLALTKLDVLDDFDEILICTEYKDSVTGKIYKDLPSIGSTFQQMTPVYKTVKGWKKPTTNCKSLKDLPKEAREYIELVEEQLEVQVAIVSVGPNRDHTVVIEDPIHGPKRVLTKPVTVSSSS